MAKRIVSALLLFSLTAQAQFFDFFPSYQSTASPNYDVYSNNRNQNNQRNPETIFNSNIPFSAFLNVPEGEQRQFFINNDYNAYTTTTKRPTRRRGETTNKQKQNKPNYYDNKNNNVYRESVYTTGPLLNDITTKSPNRQTTNPNIVYNQWDRDRTTKLPNTYDSSHNNRQTTKASYNYNSEYDRTTKQQTYDSNYNSRQTTKPPNYNYSVDKYDRTTKQPQNYDNSYNNRQTTKAPSYDNNYNRQTTKAPSYDYNPEYTTKPRTYDNNSDRQTTKPSYNNSDRTTKYATSNPFYNGVHPPVYHNGPPITNKPVTQRPSSDVLTFPNERDGVKIISGPNEDDMSDVQKRRYDELLERMCDRYKQLNQKQVLATPLLPSPAAVRVNVSCSAPPTPLIVGGQTVPAVEYAHSAAVGWRNDQGQGYSWKCGGSLISDKFILTAAHCTYQDRDSSIATGPPEVVQLGSSYLNGRNAKIYKIALVIRHPKYRKPLAYHDVAILKLASKVTFSESIRPACLGRTPPVGTKLTATGWGRTEYNGDQSTQLRGVALPVWDMRECYRVLGVSRRLPNGPSADSQMCAGDYDGGKDTCQGDSGGPIQYIEGCAWRIAGVTSLGVACGAAHTPAIYALPARHFVAAVLFQ